jgi:hypothetical protein
MDFLAREIDARPESINNFQITETHVNEIIGERYPQWKQPLSVDTPDIKGLSKVPRLTFALVENVDESLFIGYNYYINGKLVGKIRLNRGIPHPGVDIDDFTGCGITKCPIAARNDIAPGRYLEVDDYRVFIFEYVNHPARNGWVVRHGEFIGEDHDEQYFIKVTYNMGILQSYNKDDSPNDNVKYALYDKDGYCITYYQSEPSEMILYQGTQHRTTSLIIVSPFEIRPVMISDLYNFNDLNSFTEGTEKYDLYYRIYSNKLTYINSYIDTGAPNPLRVPRSGSDSFVAVFVRNLPIKPQNNAPPTKDIMEYSIKTFVNGVRQGPQFSFKYDDRMNQLSRYPEIKLIGKPEVNYHNNGQMVSPGEYQQYLKKKYYDPVEKLYIPEIASIIVDYLGSVEVVSYKLVNSLVMLRDGEPIFKRIPVVNSDYAPGKV